MEKDENRLNLDTNNCDLPNPDLSNVLLMKPFFDIFLQTLMKEKQKIASNGVSSKTVEDSAKCDNNNSLSEYKISDICFATDVPPSESFLSKVKDLAKLFSIIDVRLKDESTMTHVKLAMGICLQEIIEKLLTSSEEYVNEHYFIDFAINLFEDVLKLRQNIPLPVNLQIVRPISDFLLPIYDKARSVEFNQSKVMSPIDKGRYSRYYETIREMVNKHQSLDMICAAQKTSNMVTSNSLEVQPLLQNIKIVFAEVCPHLFEEGSSHNISKADGKEVPNCQGVSRKNSLDSKHSEVTVKHESIDSAEEDVIDINKIEETEESSKKESALGSTKKCSESNCLVRLTEKDLHNLCVVHSPCTHTFQFNPCLDCYHMFNKISPSDTLWRDIFIYRFEQFAKYRESAGETSRDLYVNALIQNQFFIFDESSNLSDEQFFDVLSRYSVLNEQNHDQEEKSSNKKSPKKKGIGRRLLKRKRPALSDEKDMTNSLDEAECSKNPPKQRKSINGITSIVDKSDSVAENNGSTMSVADTSFVSLLLGDPNSWNSFSLVSDDELSALNVDEQERNFGRKELNKVVRLALESNFIDGLRLALALREKFPLFEKWHAIVVGLLFHCGYFKDCGEACKFSEVELPHKATIIQELKHKISKLNGISSNDSLTSPENLNLDVHNKLNFIIPNFDQSNSQTTSTSAKQFTNLQPETSEESDLIYNLIQMANSSQIAKERKNVREKILLEESEHHLSDDQIMTMSVRQMNTILAGVPDIVSKILRQRRRTLKNRFYALNCRQKKKNANESLKAQVDRLSETLNEVISENQYLRSSNKLLKKGFSDLLEKVSTLDPQYSVDSQLLELVSAPDKPPTLMSANMLGNRRSSSASVSDEGEGEELRKGEESREGEESKKEEEEN